MRKLSTVGILVLATFASGTVHAADPNYNAPVIVYELTSCVGKYEAAHQYSTYVAGYTQAHLKASTALKRLLATLRVRDMTLYEEAVASASRAFKEEFLVDPVYIRDLVARTIVSCDITTNQAMALGAGIKNREVEALALRQAEQQFMVAAKKAAEEHAHEMETARREAVAKAAAKDAESAFLLATAKTEQALLADLDIERTLSKLRDEMAVLAKKNNSAAAIVARLEADIVGVQKNLEGARLQATDTPKPRSPVLEPSVTEVVEPVSKPASSTLFKPTSSHSQKQAAAYFVGKTFARDECNPRGAIVFGAETRTFVSDGKPELAEHVSYEMAGDLLKVHRQELKYTDVFRVRGDKISFDHLEFGGVPVKADPFELVECNPIEVHQMEFRPQEPHSAEEIGATYAISHIDPEALRAFKKAGVDLLSDVKIEGKTYIEWEAGLKGDEIKKIINPRYDALTFTESEYLRKSDDIGISVGMILCQSYSGHTKYWQAEIETPTVQSVADLINGQMKGSLLENKKVYKYVASTRDLLLRGDRAMINLIKSDGWHQTCLKNLL